MVRGLKTSIRDIFDLVPNERAEHERLRSLYMDPLRTAIDACLESEEVTSALGSEVTSQDVRRVLIDHLKSPLTGEIDYRSDLAAVKPEVDELDRLVSALVLARTQSRRLARDASEGIAAAVEAAEKRLVQATVDRLLLPIARRHINDVLGEVYETSFSAPFLSGFSQMLPEEIELKTSAVRSVWSLLAQPTAAIGVSGPRGSGKSTLIDFFCRRGGPHGLGSYARRWPETGLQVSAPVQYNSRDFFLHLFAELCKIVVGVDKLPVRTAAAGREPSQVALSASRGLFMILLRLLIFGGGLATISFSFLLSSSYTTIPLDVRTGRQAIAVAVVAWASLNLSYAVKNYTGNAKSFFIMLHHLKRPHRPLLLFSAIAAAGAFVLILSSVKFPLSLSDQQLAYVTATIGSATVGLSAWRLLRWQRAAGHPEITSVGDLEAESIIYPRSNLAIRAEAYLSEIRFQQTFTSGWGGKVGIGPSGASAEISGTEGISLARSAWTLPETVANLRSMLAAVAENKSRFVIGIDEIDKIAETSEAARFINDLKAIFHIPGCYFLVSVSDDALTSFEGRGLPLRDEFDSAFDEIVRVEFASFEESREILVGRVLRLPLIFCALSHALSGGLPRDLLRTSRTLCGLGQRIELQSAVRAMVSKELLRRLPATMKRVGRTNTPAQSG